MFNTENKIRGLEDLRERIENITKNLPGSGERNYDKWFIVKKKIQEDRDIPKFSVGEVWWCGIGENVGVEINGKGKKFARPALILKKYNSYSAKIIPLSTVTHHGDWYSNFFFDGRNQCALLHQDQPIDAARLYFRMGELPSNAFNTVLEDWKKLYL